MVNKVQQEMITHTELVGQVLQFTLTIFVALCAIGIMLRKQQLDHMLPGRSLH